MPYDISEAKSNQCFVPFQSRFFFVFAWDVHMRRSLVFTFSRLVCGGGASRDPHTCRRRWKQQHGQV